MDARIRMKAWRQYLGLSKLAFAHELDVWPSQVTMWESDKYELQPTHGSIDKLCELAEISPSRFWGALPKAKTKAKPKAKRAS